MCIACVAFNRVLACVINVDLVGDLVVVWISLDVVCSVEGVEVSVFTCACCTRVQTG